MDPRPGSVMNSQVVLYSGQGCSLCEDAAQMLKSMGIEFTTSYSEEFALRIPVITVDGKVITESRVSRRAVAAAIRRARKRQD